MQGIGKYRSNVCAAIQDFKLSISEMIVEPAISQSQLDDGLYREALVAVTEISLGCLDRTISTYPRVFSPEFRLTREHLTSN